MISKRFIGAVLALVAALCLTMGVATGAALPSFNTQQTYSTVTDLDGKVYAYQNGIYYDQQGNAWLSLPLSKNGYAAVTFSGQPTTFANLPAASGYSGQTLYVSDVGTGGSYWTSNGTQWSLVGGVANLYQVGLPVGLPPSGTLASNGALTLGTALDQIYPSIYFYMPAGVFTGSAAGMYYASCSSTTVCTLYQNQYTSGVPNVPTNLIPITTGAGAYTQTTATYITVMSFTMPAGVMGTTGSIMGKFLATADNNANLKIIAPLGGFGTQSGNVQLTAVNSRQGSTTITNANSASSQMIQQGPDYTSSGGTIQLLSVNTANAVAVTPQLYLATATDWAILQSYQLSLYR